MSLTNNKTNKDYEQDLWKTLANANANKIISFDDRLRIYYNSLYDFTFFLASATSLCMIVKRSNFYIWFNKQIFYFYFTTCDKGIARIFSFGLLNVLCLILTFNFVKKCDNIFIMLLH